VDKDWSSRWSKKGSAFGRNEILLLVVALVIILAITGLWIAGAMGSVL
jgi:hypothetical protein